MLSPGKGTWVVRTCGGQKVQFPESKVLVKWLRRLGVPPLFLAWDVRLLLPEKTETQSLGAGVGAEERSKQRLSESFEA